MIKQGMNLTKEQCGEVKQETKMDGSSASAEFSDDKKSANESDDSKNIQYEYIKAYYAALLKQQQELEEAAKKQQEFLQALISNGVAEASVGRQVGMKSKDDEDEGNDDVVWEEAPVGGNTREHYKVNDLNVEAEASGGEMTMI